jgi:hypothetical protein
MSHRQPLETWGDRKPEAMPLRAGSRARCGKGEGSGREFTRTVSPPGAASEKVHQPNERVGSCGAGTDPLRMGAKDAGVAADAWEGWRFASFLIDRLDEACFKDR